MKKGQIYYVDYSMSNVWYGSYNGSDYVKTPTDIFGVRPTLHLKSTVKILSGSGIEQDPYVVGL